MQSSNCSVISLTDTELIGLVACANHRILFIAPGLSLPVAQALAHQWEKLGAGAVQVVLDTDPEVCRLGLGDIEALKLLQSTAERLRSRIHQQQGLRIGVVITDETTTIYSP